MASMVAGRGRVRGRRMAVAATIGIAAGLAAASPAVALEGTDIITTFAGTGVATSSGDGGPATAAGVPGPVGIAAATDGRLVIPEPSDNRVRIVAANGVIANLTGNGTAGFSGDGGPAGAAQVNGPRDAAFDAAGNIYIADRDNDRIRRIAPNGIITTVAGSGGRGFSGDGGPALAAELNNPVGVAVDAAGNLYIADALNRRIRKVAPDGIITTFAGTGAPVTVSGGDGGPAAAATFVRPDDVRVSNIGAVLVVDSGGHNVRSIDSAGVITTIAGNGLPGNGGDGGAATAAELSTPIEIAFDPFNNLYISDAGGNRIRRVNTAGLISTIAGTGTRAFSGDGGPAASAELAAPSGVSLNSAGDLFIADSGNNRVRVITNPNPFVPTPAPGTGGRLDVPRGSAACNAIPAAPTPKKGSGKVAMTAQQLLINQRISQAAVRRVNAVQAWLGAGLVTNDLCGGAFVAQSFGPTITLGSTSTLVPGASQRPKPRPVTPAKATPGNVKGVKLEAQQLLISQRISQAAVRRANGLTARLDNGLTGGDLRPGAVTPEKVAVGLTVVAAALGGDVAPSQTKVAAPGPRRGGKVTLSTTQILINQRVAQAAVRRSNALIDRIGAGFFAGDFQAATLSRRDLGTGLLP